MPKSQNNLIRDDLARIYPHFAERLDQLFGKTILITGGCGFIGSWIAELVHFLNREQKAAITLYLLDKEIDQFIETLPHIQSDDSITVTQGDTRQIVEIPKSVNYLIHAAATPDRRLHASCPTDLMTSIACGTANVLRKAGNLSKLLMYLNVSSSSVYDAGKTSALITEQEKGNPPFTTSASAYSEASRFGEALCAAMRSETSMPIATVRPFTFCGAYQNIDAPWFLNSFIKDGVNNRPICLSGDGKSIRSLLYGADLAFWMLTILINIKSGETFNVGSDKGMQIKDIADIVAEKMPNSRGINLNTALIKPEETTSLVPNITSAKEKFNLDIYTDARLAISRTIDWYKYSI